MGGVITPFGSQQRVRETKNTVSSRSSPRVCNENIRLLEDVYAATSPQNFLRAQKSGTPSSHSGSAAVISGRKLIKASSNPNSPLQNSVASLCVVNQHNEVLIVTNGFNHVNDVSPFDDYSNSSAMPSEYRAKGVCNVREYIDSPEQLPPSSRALVNSFVSTEKSKKRDSIGDSHSGSQVSPYNQGSSFLTHAAANIQSVSPKVRLMMEPIFETKHEDTVDWNMYSEDVQGTRGHLRHDSDDLLCEESIDPAAVSHAMRHRGQGPGNSKFETIYD